jgi:predicted nuclease with TOPRIM domain
VETETNLGPPKPSSSRQTRLNSDSARRRDSTERSGPDPCTSTAEGKANSPELQNIMEMLTCLNTKFDSMTNHLKDVKDSVSGLKDDDVQELKETVCDLRVENDSLKLENGRMNDRLVFLEKKVDDLERRSKRNNLIFHVIPRREGETKNDCEDLVYDVLTDKLQLSKTVQFDRVHQ